MIIPTWCILDPLPICLKFLAGSSGDEKSGWRSVRLIDGNQGTCKRQDISTKIIHLGSNKLALTHCYYVSGLTRNLIFMSNLISIGYASLSGTNVVIKLNNHVVSTSSLINGLY